MRREYHRPPIIEALCDLHFEPGQAWDLTIPGLMYSRVQGDFPIRRQRGSLSFQVKPQEGEPIPEVRASSVMTHMQFVRADGETMIQVGPDNLTINQLQQYPGWPTFKNVISNAIGHYRDVASPKSVVRVSLRYINRIEILEPQRASQYVLTIPGVPSSMPSRFTGWVQRVEVPYEAQKAVLGLQSGLAFDQTTEGKPIILLDLDFYTDDSFKMPIEEVLPWVEQAHEQVESVFEACITDEARRLFGEKTKHE